MTIEWTETEGLSTKRGRLLHVRAELRRSAKPGDDSYTALAEFKKEIEKKYPGHKTWRSPPQCDVRKDFLTNMLTMVGYARFSIEVGDETVAGSTAQRGETQGPVT